MPSVSTSATSQAGPRELKILTTPFSTVSSSSSSPPPPTPCPWLWRCHSCYTIYRLSVTRRCLDCDHTFCLGDAAGAGPASHSGKKRKRGGPCKAEFDYTGWKTHGAWRRTVLLNGDGGARPQTKRTKNAMRTANWGDEHKAATTSEPTTTFDAKREHLFLRKQHNCFLHCDFPSECHHALFRAQQEGRPILREALALDDAAAEASQLGYDGSGSGGGNTTKKSKLGRGLSTVHENGGTRFPYSLPRVDEAADEQDPVSPVSPDPPGALMREVVQVVSPVERSDDDEDEDTLLLPPVSPGGTTRRRSLLVATDTPADFATTAAALCFDDDDDTYSDDESTPEKSHRHAKRSRRKINQLTGQEFGPFVFDTSSSSPTSPPPSTSGATTSAQKAALDLQAAYSESAWFGGNPAVTTTISADPTPRSPERAGKRDRMLALLGRRAVVGGGEASDPSRSSREVDVDVHVRVDSVPAAREKKKNHHNHPQEQVAGEEWDDWSDSSSSTLASSSVGSEPDTDADGDVAMRDAGAALSHGTEYDGDEDEAPVTPPRRQRSGGDGTDADLRALLRMRNAFMRGDMI